MEGVPLAELEPVKQEENDSHDSPGAMQGSLCSSLGYSICSSHTSSPFTLHSVLGKGTFGVVYNAIWNQQRVAIKQVQMDEDVCHREVQILELLQKNQSPFLMVPHDTVVHGASSYIIMERATCDFRKLLESMPSRQVLSRTKTIQTLHDILHGLVHLHRMHICHRDLKPSNLLVFYPFHVRIADFGSAKKLEKDKPSTTYITTRFYRAPECVLDNPYYTTKMDCWAVGCIAAELLTKRPLFRGRDQVDLLVCMLRMMGNPTSEEFYDMNPNISPAVIQQFCTIAIGKKTWEQRLGREVGDPMQSLLQHLLQYSPKMRASASDALQQSLFKDIDPTRKEGIFSQ